MTLGGTNSSLFTGDIEFNSLTTVGSQPTFWMLEMSGTLRLTPVDGGHHPRPFARY